MNAVEAGMHAVAAHEHATTVYRLFGRLEYRLRLLIHDAREAGIGFEDEEIGDDISAVRSLLTVLRLHTDGAHSALISPPK